MLAVEEGDGGDPGGAAGLWSGGGTKTQVQICKEEWEKEREASAGFLQFGLFLSVSD